MFNMDFKEIDNRNQERMVSRQKTNMSRCLTNTTPWIRMGEWTHISMHSYPWH